MKLTTAENQVIKKAITETLQEAYRRAELKGTHPLNCIDEAIDALESVFGESGVAAIVAAMSIKA